MIDELLGHLRAPLHTEDVSLHRSQGVRFESTPEPCVARIHSPHHAIRLRVPVDGDLMESSLPLRATISELFDVIEGLGGLDPVESLNLLRILLDAGVYRRQLPGEGDILVPLGLSGVDSVNSGCMDECEHH